MSGALSMLGGAVWWIVKPRLQEFLRKLDDRTAQLDHDHGSSVKDYAKRAADGVDVLPALVGVVDQLVDRVAATQRDVASTNRRLTDHILASAEIGVAAGSAAAAALLDQDVAIHHREEREHRHA